MLGEEWNRVSLLMLVPVLVPVLVPSLPLQLLKPAAQSKEVKSEVPGLGKPKRSPKSSG